MAIDRARPGGDRPTGEKARPDIDSDGADAVRVWWRGSRVARDHGERSRVGDGRLEWDRIRTGEIVRR